MRDRSPCASASAERDLAGVVCAGAIGAQAPAGRVHANRRLAPSRVRARLHDRASHRNRRRLADEHSTVRSRCGRAGSNGSRCTHSAWARSCDLSRSHPRPASKGTLRRDLQGSAKHKLRVSVRARIRTEAETSRSSELLAVLPPKVYVCLLY